MARKFQRTLQSGHTVLVVDDVPEMLESTRQLLEGEGHRVFTAPDGHAALEVVQKEHPHLILCDFFMPEMTGEDVVREVRKIDRLVQIILVTGYSGEKPARVMMRQLDIQGYHDKSEGAERLLLWVDSALKSYEHARAMEKHRLGLRYILEITPELHRIQPLDELLQGLLWQIEGLMGAENSFLATYPSETLNRAARDESSETFIALVEEEDSRSRLEIRVGTGRFRPGIVTSSLPEPERKTVEQALQSGTVRVTDGVSVVPLRLGSQQLGVIYTDRHLGFERDRELVEIFSYQAAAAIQNSLLFGRNAQLLNLATRDQVTGAMLRGYAVQQLHRQIKRSHRNGTALSAMMIDLNKFKQVNDTYGHVVGDDALRAVGDLLVECVRDTDMVGRYGGDEFIVILPDTGAQGAHVVGERILEAARTLTVEAEDKQVPISLSLGACTLLFDPPEASGMVRHEDVDSLAKELVERADRALYAAKGLGIVGEETPFSFSEFVGLALAG